MSQAEADFKRAIIELFGMCGWEALLVCPSRRMILPDATLYRLYVQSVRELEGEK